MSGNRHFVSVARSRRFGYNQTVTSILTLESHVSAMRIYLLAGLFIAATVTQGARADGLIYQLPKDGTSVTFDMEVSGLRNGQEKIGKGSLVVSSVGEVTIENEKCRWIEFKLAVKLDERERISLFKALIPEKHLGKGQAAGEHILRGWARQNDGTAVEITDTRSNDVGPIAAFLTGPPKDPKVLEKTEIDGKLGKLQCPGLSGETALEQGGSTFDLKFEHRLHEKAPFGVVTSTWEFERKNNGQVGESGKFKLTYIDSQTAAVSELPDNK
jgi:hypothetical protein